MMAPALVTSSGVFKTSLTMKDTYPQYHPCWWFDNYLPEPYRSQAIRNCAEDVGNEYSVCNAIYGAFVWEDTEQKSDYWHKLAERIRQGEFNTPLP